MDVVLKVLAGAKEGGKVTIKKEKFLIGRSPKCHLCAGSTAISRKHCVIRRTDSTVFVQDLGSRNGTLVNGKKVEDQYELVSGDELTVGPLKFLVTISHGINNTKKPEVKSVADAVERTVAKGDSSLQDNDVTDWLLEPSEPASQSFSETRTIELDDTNALQMHLRQQEQAEKELVEGLEVDEQSASDAEDADNADNADEENTKGPGKLPPVPQEPATKDSREAAVEALRNWNRRR